MTLNSNLAPRTYLLEPTGDCLLPTTNLQLLTSNSKPLLKRLARKYIWWKTADEAVRNPERVLTQVMNLGDYADVEELADKVGDSVLRQALVNAEAGQFTERGWAYWHYRLGLAELDNVPPMPVRNFQ